MRVAATPNAGQDAILLLARVLLSLLFVIDGLGKLSGYDGTLKYLLSKGIPAPELVAPLTVLLELGGGLLVLTGTATRFVVWPMALYCLATGCIGHAFWTFTEIGPRMNQTYHFWKNFGICGAFLLLYVSGPGRLSLDAWFAQRARWSRVREGTAEFSSAKKEH